MNKTDNAINKFNHLLESKYGLSINNSSIDDLNFIFEYYTEQRNNYSSDDVRYKKAFLISEVARLMILKEIMPKPKGKKKRGSQ
jgi:hypothetical protein